MRDDKCPSTGKKIRVQIVSDRLIDQAKRLEEYFRRTESIDVVGLAVDKQQALDVARNHSFDYLIIAGYLKAERTYSVIEELQKQQKKFLTVHWAILDALIFSFCQRYKIPLQFERSLPLEDFVGFLMDHSPGCHSA
mgnify:FL=1